MQLRVLVVVLCAICTLDVLADDARDEVVNRQRRMIFNNDGDDTWLTDEPATPEGFLSVRMDHIGDCNVDTVFYCTTQGINLFTQNSEVTEVFDASSGGFGHNRMNELIAAGTDPVTLAVKACRQRGIEIFWTLRMNDIHDRWSNEFFSQWKKDNPDKLMGSQGDGSKYPSSDPRNVWTFADFEHREVRDLMVTIIEDVLNRYDVDGIDMDFLRHTAYFKETLRFEPVTREHITMLTEMVENIRKMVLAASERKGRPILLSARVFPTLALNRRFGFDVRNWVTEGRVDFLSVGGGYDPYTMPAKDMIDRGHNWGIPVYLCLSASGMVQRKIEHSLLNGGSTEAWRGAAANAWHAGADGIMTFNLFPHLPETDTTRNARAAWKEMSDPKAMVGKDKLFCIENLLHSETLGYMMKSVPVAGRLPAPLLRGGTLLRNLPVADDIVALDERVKLLRLRVCLSGLKQGDKVDVRLNGRQLESETEKPQWLVADVSPQVMKQGDNGLALAYHSGVNESLSVTSVELQVEYEE